MTAPAILAGDLVDDLVDDPAQSMAAALYSAGNVVLTARQKGLPTPMWVGVAPGADVQAVFPDIEGPLAWQTLLEQPEPWIAKDGDRFLYITHVTGERDGRRWVLAPAVAR